MEHLNLLRKIAWSFHKSTGLDWDDLFQEAYVAYEYAMNQYKPESKVPISSFIWTHVSNQLKTYYQKELKYIYPLVNAYRTDVTAHTNLQAWVVPHPEYEDHNFKESLDQDSIEIAELLIGKYWKFLPLPPRDVNSKIIEIMRKRGWSLDRIFSGINNLRMYLTTSIV